MFGELAAIDKQPRTASIVTVIETFAMRVRAEEFLNMLWAYRVVGERILQRLTHLTRFLCERVVEFRALPVAGRIRVELMRLANAQVPDGNTVTLLPAPSQQDLANRAGTHREAVNRELKLLEKKGILRRTGNALVICDMETLVALVQEAMGGPMPSPG